MKETDSFYSELNEPYQSCMLALRSIILEQDENITETQKWGLPCFCYKNRMFCFLSVDKQTKEPYILVVEGRLIDNPILETGNRSKMKILRVDPHKDLPVSAIVEILNQALELYRTGIIKSK